MPPPPFFFFPAFCQLNSLSMCSSSLPLSKFFSLSSISFGDFVFFACVIVPPSAHSFVPLFSFFSSLSTSLPFSLLVTSLIHSPYSSFLLSCPCFFPDSFSLVFLPLPSLILILCPHFSYAFFPFLSSPCFLPSPPLFPSSLSFSL